MIDIASAPPAPAPRGRIRTIEPSSYRSHYLHDQTRTWPESNCAADLWIEALHSLGFDPTLALGFTLSADFEGEQWRMFKFDAADLRQLFGVNYDEINIWRPLVWHLAEQIALGRMATVDVDAWYLPDTAGLTYRTTHQKTTIMVQLIDRDQRSLGYFHNTGYHELRGDDFDALLDTDGAIAIPPYVESLRLDGLKETDESTVELGRELAARHLARRPATNPIRRLAQRVDQDLPWVAAADMETFHRYAFGTIRQAGANAELAASYSDWLAGYDPEVGPAANHFREVATGMKALEFLIARAARGRAVDLAPNFAAMGDAWDAAMDLLDERCG